MARKKKTTINLSIFKYAIIGILSLGCVFLVCFGIYKLVSQSTLFTIKAITIDEPVSFINEDIFIKIKGQNIFKVDLGKLQKRLTYRYPQISDLKVIRQFPDKLLITAKKRLPFLQIMVQDVIVTLDDQGVVVSTKSKRDEAVPFAIGIDERNLSVSLGKVIRSKEVKVLIAILKRFQSTDSLNAYDVAKMHIETYSRIHLYLTNDLHVIMDADRFSKKLKDLGLFLSSKRIDIRNTKYVDLRYKDIVVKENSK